MNFSLTNKYPKNNWELLISPYTSILKHSVEFENKIILNGNTFTIFLNLLNVKHTKTFSNRYFNEHPHKNNLFGLSKMLWDYGVDNGAIQIDDKETNISNIETPFIAHVGGYLVNVYKVDDQEVYYIWNGQDINISTDEFCQSWSGVVLLAEPDKNSLEPNYRKHKKIEQLKQIQWLLLFVAIITMFVVTYISNSLFSSWGLTIVLVLSIAGLCISNLLMKKQLRIHSSYADKICSLFKQGDCNDVLESKASKLFDIIGWSEIGWSYFLSNIIILLFAPQSISYLALINIIALPYSFWSVWYQKVKAKQWCPLCLIVQGILWVIFIVNLLFGFIQLPEFNFGTILTVGCIYAIPILTISIITSKLERSEKIEQITQQINSIKANDKVFLALLKAQPHYDVDRFTSNILFGDPDSQILITILTNPHCNPCAKMHARIERMLESGRSNLCVQYIFSSFSEELNSSNKLLIAAHLNNDAETAKNIYTEWFEWGKSSKDVFWAKFEQDGNSELVEQEFQRHEYWREQTRVRATPTILVNGYELPWSYKVEDITYFSDLDVDPK